MNEPIWKIRLKRLACKEGAPKEFLEDLVNMFNKLEELENKNQLMKEALQALKLRIHFIGMPQEPMIDMSDQGGPERVPDWQREIELLEKALKVAK